jgi:hypothetical protein
MFPSAKVEIGGPLTGVQLRGRDWHRDLCNSGELVPATDKREKEYLDAS